MHLALVDAQAHEGRPALIPLLTGVAVSVGRSATSSARLRSIPPMQSGDVISLAHAELRVSEDGIELRDHSTNGCVVIRAGSGETTAVKHTVIRGVVAGDVVVFGPTGGKFRYEVRAGGEALAANAAPRTSEEEPLSQEAAATAQAMDVDDGADDPVPAAPRVQDKAVQAPEPAAGARAFAEAGSGSVASPPSAAPAVDEWLPSEFAQKVLGVVHAKHVICDGPARFVAEQLHATLLALADAAAALLNEGSSPAAEGQPTVLEDGVPEGAHTGGGPTVITSDLIKGAVRRVLSPCAGLGELTRLACSACDYKAETLTLPVAAIASTLAASRPTLPALTSEAAISLTAVVEYFGAELLEHAGLAAAAQRSSAAAAQGGAAAPPGVVYTPAEEMERAGFEGLVFVRVSHVREGVTHDAELSKLYPHLVAGVEEAHADSATTAARDNAGAGGRAPGGEATAAADAMEVSEAAGAAAPAAEEADPDFGMEEVEKASVTPDVFARFNYAVNFVHLRRAFTASGAVAFSQPLLLVDGMEDPLAFPIAAAQARQIDGIGERTPQGTFVPKHKLSFGALGWKAAVAVAVVEVKRALGLESVAAHAVLRGLLLCSASTGRVELDSSLCAAGAFGCLEVRGAQHSPHRHHLPPLPATSTPPPASRVAQRNGLKGTAPLPLAAPDRSFALTRLYGRDSMVSYSSPQVVLPSIRTGGSLTVRHCGEEKEFVLRDPVSKFNYAAYYAGCERELRPLLSGCWIVLLYDLVRDDVSAPVPRPPAESDAAARLGRLARSWAAQKPVGVQLVPGEMVCFLEAQTGKCMGGQTPSWGLLVDDDCELGQALAAARDGAGAAFDLLLVRIDCTKTDDEPVEYQCYWGDGLVPLPDAVMDALNALTDGGDMTLKGVH